MANLNKVMLIGRLARDPELRVTPKGTPICQFSLAINREWKTEGGDHREILHQGKTPLCRGQTSP